MGVGPAAVWIMLNPSTADACADDPTVRRVMGFSAGWGYAGAVVVNLYPYRATDPKDLLRWLGDAPPARALRRNAKMVSDAVHGRHGTVGAVLAAWGGKAPRSSPALLAEVLAGVRLSALGRTADGSPRHPLYQPASLTPVAYRMKDISCRT